MLRAILGHSAQMILLSRHVASINPVARTSPIATANFAQELQTRSFSGFGLRSRRPLASKITTQDPKLDAILQQYENSPELQSKVREAYQEGYAHRLLFGQPVQQPKSFFRKSLEVFMGIIVTIWFIEFIGEVIKEYKKINEQQAGTGSSSDDPKKLKIVKKPDDSAGPTKALSMKVDLDIKQTTPEEIKVRFSDVKGVDEAKEELEHIVDFLRNPAKYSRLGGTLPKGVLLVGPPGVGKTLMAKAVAGEAGVPFFYASGSEFDEVYVGTGARRMRQLFAAAKENQPCVLFIDEIDSCGAKRIASQMHPFANHTVNQMLTEMDGFAKNSGVMVLGATNRKENLDEALLRPGRFDVEVNVSVPDVKGRQDILALYLARVKVAPSLDVTNVAKTTQGFCGADLENLVNQAAVHAARERRVHITDEDVEWAKDKVIMGPEKKSKIVDKETIKNTAYHEAGHTTVAYFTEGSDPIHKVTIVPRGRSLGHTSFVPSTDTNLSKAQLKAHLDVAMGGRLGEHILAQEPETKGVSTGASNDFNVATTLATSMVKHYGMSPAVGMRVFDGDMREVSNTTKKLIDEEIKRLLDESYARAKLILENHEQQHKSLAEALMQKETLELKDIKEILGPAGGTS